jgi:hypothetical protein
MPNRHYNLGLRDYIVHCRESTREHIDALNHAWRGAFTNGELKCRIRSSIFDFKTNQDNLRRSLRAFGISRSQIPRTRLVVLAGFGGHFSRALQNMGFQVIHTDLVREYAKYPQTMPTLHSAAHELPLIRNVKAYVSFEASHVYVDNIGILTVMKGLLYTEKGIMDIGVYGHYAGSRLLDVIFSPFVDLYGIEHKNGVEGPLVYDLLAMGSGNRELLANDFKVFNEIMTNKEIKDCSIENLSHITGLSHAQVRDALDRLSFLHKVIREGIYNLKLNKKIS